MKLRRPHRHDKIRLIIFSTGDSEIRQFDFSLQRIFGWLFVGACVLIGSFVASVAIRDSLSQNETVLTSETFHQEVQEIEANVARLTEKLENLEDQTQDLEVLVGLASTDGDTSRNSGNAKNLYLASLPVDYEYQPDYMSEYLNSLEARIDQALRVQDVIEDKFLQTERSIERIPSIRPVQGGRITDKFGRRKDPFVERVKHHNGIDLSARYGTKVYAAAAGVVEFVRHRYRLNKGYGRVIILNHQNGYKTLYGHLSKIVVKRGQKVERWQLIGYSGDTGRATGPHLHYEVWRNGRPEDPENYILN